ncbi:hypothetical protein BU17DRAFT_69227 [Hysterangium stoloniferum]|nr:hypothetical protein BU17DRAFT_69227 [Hysterangium stoloniferum]
MSVDVTRKVPSFNTGTSSLSPTSRTASHRPTNSLKVAPTAQYNLSTTANTSNRTSILMASSFTSKENSVVNSCTRSGRCVPMLWTDKWKPILELTPHLNTSWPFFPFMHDSIHLIFTLVHNHVTPCLNTNGPFFPFMHDCIHLIFMPGEKSRCCAVMSYGPGAPPLSLQGPYDIMLSGIPCIVFIPLDVGHQTKSLQ